MVMPITFAHVFGLQKGGKIIVPRLPRAELHSGEVHEQNKLCTSWLRLGSPHEQERELKVQVLKGFLALKTGSKKSI